MEKIKNFEWGIWIIFENPNALKFRELLESEMEKEDNGKIGKYLFSSDNQKSLIKLAKKILLKFNLYSAKVSKEKQNKNNISGYLLCIYDIAEDLKKEGKLKQKMKKYADFKKIHYKGWKYDSQTLQEEYHKRMAEAESS